ncbi:iron chaperone [Glaciibacter superstes]|uniref:iron chaperone n=1 Tax=Glaciibacter superstes TaxID=501023 RepID=UPI0003B2FE01|nr:DUF1801 domain-containing protein [Glaciibacter superstes]
MSNEAGTVDNYIAGFPEDTQVVLQRVREMVHAAIPNAEETITYDMPTFRVGERSVVYLAGWKNHIAFYEVYPQREPLETEIAPYRSGKDTVKFPLKNAMPYDLIERLVAAIASRDSTADDTANA